MDYFNYVKQNPYLVAAGVFVVVAAVAFMAGYFFTGMLAAAGAVLAGSVLLKSGLPEVKGDEDDLTDL
jgi:hypothetical protein